MSTNVRVLSTKQTADPADLGAVLFGRTRRLVLAWLLGHPDESYYMRQIARQTGAALGGVQRELDALVGAGIVRRSVQGRQVYFQADRQSPVFPELQRLLLKTAGAADVLRGALAPYAKKIAAAIIFGSAARGALGRTSDLDLIIVGDISMYDVVEAMADAQQYLGREVNPTIYPLDEFQTKYRRGDHFLTTVLREPHVFILGSPNELAGLGAKRLVDGPPAEPSGDSRSPRRGRTRPRRQRR
jgi:predicted nucleotidyltransferase